MYNYFNDYPFEDDYYRQTNQGMQGAFPMTPGQPQYPQYQTTQTMPTFPLPAIGTTLPTGVPAGQFTAPMPLPADVTTMPGTVVSTPGTEAPVETLQNPAYTPGFLRTMIGRRVRVEFLIGTNSTTDRLGTLTGVGANYILIRLEDSDDIMLGDLYAIKFVTFYY